MVSGVVGGPQFHAGNISLGDSDATAPFAPIVLGPAGLSAALTGTAVLRGVSAVSATSAPLIATAKLSARPTSGRTGQLKATLTLSATAALAATGTGALVGHAVLVANAFAPTAEPLPALTGLHGLSHDFLTAVAKEHRWVIKVEVHTAAGDLVADITKNVTGGSITVDETAKIRRTCTLTLVGDPSLVPPQVLIDDPLSTIDMLHPAKANELWIYRGVRYPGGNEEYAQLGVFRMSKPNVVDSGSAITLTINGNDRSSVVSRLSWQKPYTLNATFDDPQGSPGGNLAAAVQNTLDYIFTSEGSAPSIYPNILYNLSTDLDFYGTDAFNNPVPFTYPITTWGGDPTNPSDPMSDLATFVAGAGAELFFDVQGNVVLRPIVQPSTAPVVDSIHFKEGDNCTMVDIQRTIDETTAYNGVILYCNGTGVALPFVVRVWDINADSPTYYLGPWGQVPYRMTTTIIPAGADTIDVARQKGEQMAYQQLQLLLGSMDVVSIDTVPNPALQEGDCLLLERDRMKVADPYVISSMTIPLDPQSNQQIHFRPQVNAH